MSLEIVPSSSAGGLALSAQTQVVATTTNNTGTGFVGGGGDATAYTGVSSGEATSVDHDTGSFVPAAGLVAAGNIGHHRLDQPMAKTTLGNFLTRDVLIRTVTDMATAYSDAFFPWRDWASNTYVAEKLNNFNFIRGTLRVHGLLVGPPLASGLVIINAVPHYEAVVPDTVPITHCLSTLNVVVDCSKSNSWELRLPWMVSSNWGNLEDDLYDTSWSITIRVMTPVKAAIADGCAAVTMRVFAAPLEEDFEVAGPTFQSRTYRGTHARPTITPIAPSSTPAPVSGSSGATAPKIAQDVSASVKSATGYKPSELLAGGAFMSGLVAMFPPARPFAVAAGTAMGMLSSALDYFGLTRATTVIQIEEALLHINENLINADGGDTSRKAALFSKNITDPNPMVVNALSSVDECSMAYLNSKYGYIGKYTYTVGDLNPDDHLLAVTPMYYAETLAPSSFAPVTAAYIGMNFAYWRGDVKFLFYPVVSAVHHGSFQFIWQPVPRGGTTTDLTNLSINVEVPIEPGRPYEVTIGYQNDYPMAGTELRSINSTVTETDYATVNGYLIIRNLNPITGSACGDTIDVHVWVAGGENLQFGGPTGFFIMDGEPHDFLEYRPLCPFQSKVVGDTFQEVSTIELVPSSGPYPIQANLMGEEILSIRALMMKPSLFQPTRDDDTKVGLLADSDNIFYMNHAPYTTPSTGSDYLHWFGSMFLGFAGAIRYKVQILKGSGTLRDEDYQSFPMITHDYGLGGTYPTTEINPTDTDMGTGGSYAVPFYHHELYVPAYKEGPRRDVLSWLGPGANVMLGSIYRSIDESARFVYWRGPNYVRKTIEPTDIVVRGPLYQMELGDQDVVWPNPPPPLVAREAAKTPKGVMSDEQYRARTGRKTRKIPV